MRIAVEQNQGLKQNADQYLYGCNLRQDKIEDLHEEILKRDRMIGVLKEAVLNERDQAKVVLEQKIYGSSMMIEEQRR